MNDNYEELDIMNMDTTPEQNVEDAAESTPTGSEKKPNRKNRKRNIITAIVILLMLAIVAGLGYMAFGPQRNDSVLLEENIKAEIGQLEGKTNAEIEAALNAVVEEGSMAISINMNPVFIDGDSEGTLKIENSPANHYGQRVIITLDDTGEEIYDSGFMPVNSHIQSDKLSVHLEKGEYAATATFTAYDEDSQIEVGQAAAKIQISILN